MQARESRPLHIAAQSREDLPDIRQVARPQLTVADYAEPISILPRLYESFYEPHNINHQRWFSIVSVLTLTWLLCLLIDFVMP
ncbi:hypothetical protein LRP88_11544 [Fusarium phalaenopsidis]